MKAVWCYKDCLTPTECSRVIELGGDLQAGTVGVVGGQAVDTSIRNSRISWIRREDHPWLFDIVDHEVRVLNDTWLGLRYYHTGCESLQFTAYKEGEYYHSHVDSTCVGDGKDVRKVSCSILLNTDFEGGELIVDGGSIEKPRVGQITVFPGIVPHEVKKVTSGTRYSLVGWWMGPPWI